MAAHTPGPENVVILVGGTPVSNVNPLPTSGGGGGGGGVVDQGKQGSIAQPWFIQPTADGKTVSLPLPTGAATAAKQDTGNTSLSNIDGKVATETTLASVETLLGAGLPVALSGGRLDVNIGSTGVTQPISGTVTANVGTTGGLALDATLTGGTQRSKVTDGTNNAAVVNTAPSTEYGLVVRNIPSGTQPVSALSLPLPSGAATSALQGGGLPAALVGGRLDVNAGAWLGSTSPTVGQKAMSASVPVVVASDQSTLPVVQPSATYSVIYTSTTTTVASSACTLYKIFWTAGVGSTMAVYDDGSGGTTNQFVSKLTSSDGEIDFGPLGVRLSNGLTVVTTGGTPAFVTIVLRT